MEFGIFLRNERHHRVAARSWEEDLAEIVLAERLGFSEAWLAEHFYGGGRPGVLSSSELLICKAAGLTKHIRLGPGIRVLPLHHPVQVATQAAVCDHLTGGRYMAGFGAGGEQGEAVAQLGLGQVDQQRAMMHEAIDLIERCFTEPEPFDYAGRFWQCRHIAINPKPLQQPLPTGLACTRTHSTLQLAAERGYMPLVNFMDGPAGLREMAEVFVQAGEAAGRRAPRSAIRVPRFVHVSDSVAKARAQVRDGFTPILDRRKRAFPWQFTHAVPPGGTVEDITFDYMADIGGIVVGDPDTVAEQLKAIYDEIGGFGTLLLIAGHDVGTPEQRVRSWRLFMQHVAPRFADLDPDRKQPVAALF
jgi:alkanesulfonate monooxygenase SsuD/methylene tetrahydromethanopterin reductase-like flavin-dependent oxidoreductase (luciferase family)